MSINSLYAGSLIEDIMKKTNANLTENGMLNLSNKAQQSTVGSTPPTSLELILAHEFNQPMRFLNHPQIISQLQQQKLLPTQLIDMSKEFSNDKSSQVAPSSAESMALKKQESNLTTVQASRIISKSGVELIEPKPNAGHKNSKNRIIIANQKRSAQPICRKDPSQSMPLLDKEEDESEQDEPEEEYKANSDIESDDSEEDLDMEVDIKAEVYMATRTTRRNQKPLEKRKAVTKEEQNKVNKDLNEAELLQRLKNKIERLVGFTDIDESKVYLLWVKNEMSIEKAAHRVFRNRSYYRKYFAPN